MAALAGVVVVLEADPWAEVLEVVGEPKAVGRKSAAWVVVPVGCLEVEVPSEVLDSKASLGRQLPMDAHKNWLLSAVDLADRQAAVPALAFHEWDWPEAQTASDMVLWTPAEHKRSPTLQKMVCSEPS